jgi:hypothetical protein
MTKTRRYPSQMDRIFTLTLQFRKCLSEFKTESKIEKGPAQGLRDFKIKAILKSQLTKVYQLWESLHTQ